MKDEQGRGGALSQEEREFVEWLGALERRIRRLEEKVAALEEARRAWRALLAEARAGRHEVGTPAGEAATAEPGEEGDSIDEAREAEARQSSAAAPVEDACNNGYERGEGAVKPDARQEAEAKRRSPSYRHLSDEALLAAVQARLREMARGGIAPNQLEWDDLRGSELPTRGGVVKRLRMTWAEIVAGAGLQVASRAKAITRGSTPREIESESESGMYADLAETVGIRQPERQSEEELREAVAARLREMAAGQYGPSCTMWDAQRGSLPTTTTVTKRLGQSWREVLAGAGLRQRPPGVRGPELAASIAGAAGGGGGDEDEDGEGEGEGLHRAAAMPLGALEPVNPEDHDFGLPVLRKRSRVIGEKVLEYETGEDGKARPAVVERRSLEYTMLR